MADYRITQFPERTEVDSTDFVLMDSDNNGTNKFALVRMHAAFDTAIDTETQARAAADEAMQGSIEQLETDMETAINTKASINGTYPSLAVGSLLGNSVEDKVPYLFRPTGGDLSVGDREYDTLVGGTVVWNQLVQNGDFSSGDSRWSTRYSTLTVTDGIAMFVPKESGTARGIVQTGNTKAVESGHKYLLHAEIKPSDNLSFSLSFGGANIIDTPVLTSGVWTGVDAIWTYQNATFNCNIAIYSNGAMTTEQSAQVRSVMAIDLTALFGSTIADYIYSLEQTTAGSGVAWFRKYFPNDFYPYSTPTLKSVEGLTAHEMVGFNQWDEEWEPGGINANSGNNASIANRIRSKNFSPCFGGMRYYVCTGFDVTHRIFWYDAEKTYITYIQGKNFSTTPPTNARFFKVSVEGSTYGETYRHDICINLSDPQKNGTYEPYVKHSYPLDSTWIGRGMPKLDSANKLYYDGDVYAHDGMVTRTWAERAYQSGDASDGSTMITDGTRTVYKLTTPTTETATPYEQAQICDPNGTEQYVTESIVPVGHETEYPENLATKIESLPALPTTAGTYRLKVTVTAGKASYEWVSA